MKSVLHLLLLCSTIHFAGAQKIRFTDTSNKWTLLEMDWGDYPITTSSVQYAGFTADTLFHGTIYHRLEPIGVANSYAIRPLAVREDTSTGVIYFRFITTSYFLSGAIDSLEHVLFDYRLRPGDTLKIDNASTHFRHIVLSFDSVMLGLSYHKRWEMSNAGSTGSSFPVTNYTFIEGIGTTISPIFSIYPSTFENSWQLRCFHNGDGQPLCTPRIHLTNNVRVPAFGVYGVDTFDNLKSCSFTSRPNAVALTHKAQGAIPFPNPGDNMMSIRFPTPFTGTVAVSNAFGSVIFKQKIEDKTEMLIGQYLTVPGVYHFMLQDAATGQRYTGRFVFAP